MDPNASLSFCFVCRVAKLASSVPVEVLDEFVFSFCFVGRSCDVNVMRKGLFFCSSRKTKTEEAPPLGAIPFCIVIAGLIFILREGISGCYLSFEIHSSATPMSSMNVYF